MDPGKETQENLEQASFNILSFFRKYINSILSFAFLSSLLIIPLSFSALYPNSLKFLSLKLFYFSLILFILFILVGLKFYLEPESLKLLISSKKSLKKKIGLAFLFLFLLLLVTLRAGNFSLSFFGSYEKRAGLLVFFNLAFFYSLLNIFLASIKKTVRAKFLTQFSFFLATSSLLSSVYAFLQYCGLDWINGPGVNFFEVPSSSFAHPKFLANFIILSLPLNVYALIKKDLKFWPRLFFLLTIALQILALILSQGLIALLALIFSILIVSLVFLLPYFKKLKKLKVFIILLLSILSSFAILSLGNLVLLNKFKANTFRLWQRLYSPSLELVSTKPMFGWGLTNLDKAFSAKLGLDQYSLLSWNDNFESISNIFIDIILQTGFLGLIIFLIFLFLSLKKLIALAECRDFKRVAIFSLISILALGISLSFSSLDFTNLFIFVFLLGLLHGLGLEQRVENEKEAESQQVVLRDQEKSFFYLNSSQFLKILLAFFLAYSAANLYLHSASLRADIYGDRAWKAQNNNDDISASFYMILFDRLAIPAPYNAYYQNRYFSGLINRASLFSDNFSFRRLERLELERFYKESQSALYKDAYLEAKISCALGHSNYEELFSQVLESSENNFLFHFNIAQCYFRQERRQDAQDSFFQSLEQVKEAFLKAGPLASLSRLHTFESIGYLNLAINEELRDNKEEALYFYKKYNEIIPFEFMVLRKIIDLNKDLGNEEEALRLEGHLELLMGIGSKEEESKDKDLDYLNNNKESDN